LVKENDMQATQGYDIGGIPIYRAGDRDWDLGCCSKCWERGLGYLVGLMTHCRQKRYDASWQYPADMTF